LRFLSGLIPIVLRKYASEPIPTRRILRNLSSDIARISPIVLSPAAFKVFRISGEKRTISINVSSGRLGSGSNTYSGYFGLVIGRTPSHVGRPNVSRSSASELFPKAGRLINVSSDVSRTSPGFQARREQRVLDPRWELNFTG
jgi:hypothetical protein